MEANLPSRLGGKKRRRGGAVRVRHSFVRSSRLLAVGMQQLTSYQTEVGSRGVPKTN
jgi:hypothetical protein